MKEKRKNGGETCIYNIQENISNKPMDSTNYRKKTMRCVSVKWEEEGEGEGGMTMAGRTTMGK